MDTFFEQIVVKKKTAADYALIALIVFAALAVSMLIFFFLIPLIGVLATVLMMGALYGAWWLITNRSIEFEYCVTNGEMISGMDVDMIIARRKRKRIVQVSGNKIESLTPYRAAEFAGRRFDRRVMAVTSPQAEGAWAFTYHSKKKGHTLVVFEPNERVLKEFVSTLPKLVQMEAKRHMRSMTFEENADE